MKLISSENVELFIFTNVKGSYKYKVKCSGSLVQEKSTLCGIERLIYWL